MKIITLSGVDGSGKSTQLALLRKHLESQGNKVAYLHATEFSAANRIVRFFKKQTDFEPGKEKAATKAPWISVVLREKFLFLDFLRFHFFAKKLGQQGYDYLLSDRFFSDSLINISYLSDAWVVRIGMRFLEALLPKTDIAFYLDIDPKTVMSRDRVPEQGAEYLKAKQALFLSKRDDWNLVVINADQPKESVFSDIIRAL